MTRCFGKILVILLICLAPFGLRADEQEASVPVRKIPSQNHAELRFIPYKSLFVLHLDKVKHFSTSLMLVTTSGYALSTMEGMNRHRGLLLSISISSGLGLAKEGFDLLHPDKHDANWGDLAADALGVIAGGIILHNMP